MRAMRVPELLAAWDHAYGQRPAVRALSLATLAVTERDIDLACLPVGARDARLLDLRESVFGDSLASLIDCAACAEKVEFTFKTSEVRAPQQPTSVTPLMFDEYEVEWRLPTGGDLATLPPEPDPNGAEALLLERCVVRALKGHVPIAAAELPRSVRAALAGAVERADPQADVELTIVCPVCAHLNIVPFDIAAFFWDELNAWACQTLQDVHELASAYGWSESDVLAMSAFRRQVYREMLGA